MSAFYEEGLYIGDCIGQFMGQSETRGTPYFAMRFSILARVKNEQEHNVAQKERTVYMYLSEKSMPYTIENLAYLGFEGTSVAQLDPSSPNHHSFIGKRCDLWCKIEPYEGSPQEKWSVSVPYEPKPVKAIEPKDMRRLDDLFGKSMKSRKPASKSAAPAAKPAPSGGGTAVADRPAPPTQDDIPF